MINEATIPRLRELISLIARLHSHLDAARRRIADHETFLAVLDRAGITIRGEPVSEIFARATLEPSSFEEDERIALDAINALSTHEIIDLRTHWAAPREKPK